MADPTQELPALQQQQTGNPISLDTINNTDALSQEIINRANTQEKARADLANINIMAAGALGKIDQNFEGVLETQKDTVDSSFNILNDVLQNKTKAAGLPNFVTNLLGYFDDTYNMKKQELRAQGAQAQLQKVQQNVTTADAIRKTQASGVGTVLDAAKTNYSVAATSAQALRESASTIFAAQDQAFQQKMRGVQSAADNVLTEAVRVGNNPNLPAGLAQAELVRRAEQKEKLSQMQIDTGQKGLNLKQDQIKDFLNGSTTSEIEHLMAEAQKPENKNRVMLGGKVPVTLAELQAGHVAATKREEELTSRMVAAEAIPVKLKIGQTQMQLLQKAGGMDVGLVAETGALLAKVTAAGKMGNVKEQSDAAEAYIQAIKKRQDEYVKSLPKEKQNVYKNYFNNGGEVRDQVASTELMGSLFVDPNAMQGTLLQPIWKQFSDKMQEVDADNYFFRLPTGKNGASPDMSLPLRKTPMDSVVAKVIRMPVIEETDPATGKKISRSYTDVHGANVFSDAALTALRTLAEQDVLKLDNGSGASSSPFKDIVQRGKFYTFDGKDTKFSLAALVQELEIKTEEMRRAGVLDANTSLTDIFKRSMMSPEFLQNYDDKYLGSLSPEGQAFNALMVPGGRPSVLFNDYITKAIPAHQMKARMALQEQQKAADAQLAQIQRMQDQQAMQQPLSKPSNGQLIGGRNAPTGRQLAGIKSPEEQAAAIEALKQDNSFDAITQRLRTLLGVYNP